MGNSVGANSTPPELLRQLRALIPQHMKPDGRPNVRRLAEAMGTQRSTVLRYLTRIEAEDTKRPETIEFPTFVTDGDEDEDISEILSRFRKAHERKQKAIEARAWFPIRVNEDKPYGILWFGDPHLGTH
jgi:DNA-binding transcriptional MocR family regulator